MNTYTYAVIPTNGRECLYECLEAIYDQVQEIVIVEGGPNAKFLDQDKRFLHLFGNLPIIREPELNISKWWNLGLTLIESRRSSRSLIESRWPDDVQWNVVMLNDDVIVPTGWVYNISEAMRGLNAAAGCSGSPNGHAILQTKAQAVDLRTRMQGFAFMLAGEKGVRANEQLHWYFSDDHVDWLSRERGGMVMIPGYEVQHLYPNGQMTPELHEQTAKDAAAFQAYWGRRPW